ncbi:MAG: sodium:solute symporter, partial [Chloroflexota bacterium]
MNAHAIDWLIMAGFAAALIGLAAYTRRYARSVADFLAANRCAGRYLLTISQGMTGLGAISVVACFEMYYRAGFTAAWWQMCILPFMLVVTVSGWVVYRYRETRALTLAQFFEVRYSRRFRIFCGILAWVSGVINMGIFPAVTANFFIYFLGLPERLIVLGLPVSTFAALMVLELSVAVALTLMGGMVVVAITDAFQGIFANAAFLLILCVIFWRFDWSQIIAGLQAAPADASMINPFHTSGEDDFNVAYFLMNAFYTIYIFKAWQGGQGYNAAAANAHEARMAGILAQWRDLIQGLLILMLPICAFALLHHPGFAADTRAVQQVIGQIANPQLQE